MPENSLTTLTVEQFKLACIDDLNFTDAQVRILMNRVIIESEDDVREFAAILGRYRPELAKELFAPKGASAINQKYQPHQIIHDEEFGDIKVG